MEIWLLLLIVVLILLYFSRRSTRFVSEEFPASLLVPHEPDFYNLEIPLRVPSDVRFVTYWATNGPARNAGVMSETLAYNNFENSGVAAVDQGLAVLRVAAPQDYVDSTGSLVRRHINYRLVGADSISGTFQLYLPSNLAILKERQYMHAGPFAFL